MRPVVTGGIFQTAMIPRQPSAPLFRANFADREGENYSQGPQNEQLWADYLTEFIPPRHEAIVYKDLLAAAAVVMRSKGRFEVTLTQLAEELKQDKALIEEAMETFTTGRPPEIKLELGQPPYTLPPLFIKYDRRVHALHTQLGDVTYGLNLLGKQVLETSEMEGQIEEYTRQRESGRTSAAPAAAPTPATPPPDAKDSQPDDPDGMRAWFANSPFAYLLGKKENEGNSGQP
jgi:hypothetical protein